MDHCDSGIHHPKNDFKMDDWRTEALTLPLNYFTRDANIEDVGSNAAGKSDAAFYTANLQFYPTELPRKRHVQTTFLVVTNYGSLKFTYSLNYLIPLYLMSLNP